MALEAPPASSPAVHNVMIANTSKDTKDAAQVADFAEAIVWLMIPSLVIFVLTPWMLRRDYSFEASMGAGILCTIMLYGIGVWAAQSLGSVS